MKVQDSGFLSLRQVQDQYLSGTGQLKKGQERNGVSFQDILNNKQEETDSQIFQACSKQTGRPPDRAFKRTA